MPSVFGYIGQINFQNELILTIIIVGKCGEELILAVW